MVKLTKEQILKGKEYRKTLVLSTYDNAEVEIRPLTSIELEQIFTKLEKNGGRIKNDDTLASKIALMREVALIGIVDDDLKPLVNDMVGSTVQEIGAAVMELSYSTDKAVKDFSKVPTA